MRLLGIALGTLLAAGIAEVALRAGLLSSDRLVTKRMLCDATTELRTYQCYPSNPNGEFSPPPDLNQNPWYLFTVMLPPARIPLERLSETPYCVEYLRSRTATRNKLRGPLPDPRPREGVVRVLGIGDSFAFGEGVPADRTLFAQMERLLGPGHEILNAGRAGANTTTELEILEDLGAQMHARRVLFVYIANDVVLTPELESRQSYINDLINIRDENLTRHEAGAWYAGRSRLLHFLGAHFAMSKIRRETIQWYLDSYDPAKNGANLEALQRQLAALAGRPDRKVAFVIYPLMEGLERSYPLAPVHARVKQMAEAAGLPVLDLAPAFAGQRTSSLWVHPSDHHPNGKAHGIAARAVVDWLRREQPAFLKDGAR